jgi:hypothetical protein
MTTVENVKGQIVERQNAEWDKTSNGKHAEWDKHRLGQKVE